MEEIESTNGFELYHHEIVITYLLIKNAYLKLNNVTHHGKYESWVKDFIEKPCKVPKYPFLNLEELELWIFRNIKFAGDIDNVPKDLISEMLFRTLVLKFTNITNFEMLNMKEFLKEMSESMMNITWSKDSLKMKDSAPKTYDMIFRKFNDFIDRIRWKLKKIDEKLIHVHYSRKDNMKEFYELLNSLLNIKFKGSNIKSKKPDYGDICREIKNLLIELSDRLLIFLTELSTSVDTGGYKMAGEIIDNDIKYIITKGRSVFPYIFPLMHFIISLFKMNIELINTILNIDIRTHNIYNINKK